MTVFRLCLIIADTLCLATTDSKTVKILCAIAIIIMSIACLEI